MEVLMDQIQNPVHILHDINISSKLNNNYVIVSRKLNCGAMSLFRGTLFRVRLKFVRTLSEWVVNQIVVFYLEQVLGCRSTHRTLIVLNTNVSKKEVTTTAKETKCSTTVDSSSLKVSHYSSFYRLQSTVNVVADVARPSSDLGRSKGTGRSPRSDNTTVERWVSKLLYVA